MTKEEKGNRKRIYQIIFSENGLNREICPGEIYSVFHEAGRAGPDGMDFVFHRAGEM